MKRVLVLLIGEVLEDPRVFKTCRSLASLGAEVTVACTNPSGRPPEERSGLLNIVRFPHRAEYYLKRLYNWLKGNLRPSLGTALGKVHETASDSRMKSLVRNMILSRNFAHHMKSNLKINNLMMERFRGEVFDLVHANDMDTLFAACELKKAGAAREMLYDSHEYWPGIGVHGSAVNESIREIEEDGIVYADYIVTVNETIAGALREDYHLSRTPSSVMNCAELAPPPDDMSIHNPVRVVYQGKLQAFRGLDMLVEAFRFIDNAVLTFSGFGPLEESLKLLVKSLDLGDKVHFAGRYLPHETLAMLYGHDIGVIPHDDVTVNIRMSSPTKMFDYTMAGLAVASSGLPFVKSSLEETGAGYIFEALTPEGIAATITRMASDPGNLDRCKRNAREAAETSFSWERQFENYPWKP